MRLRYLRHFFLSLCIGAITLVATFFTYYLLAKREFVFLEETTRVKAEQVVSAIETHMDAEIKSLERMAIRWKAGGGTRRFIWEADAVSQLKEKDGLIAIGWMDSSFKLRWHKEGSSSFQWKQLLLQKELSGFDHTQTNLLQMRDNQRELFLFLPLFSNGSFDGWILAVFDLSSLLDVLIPEGLSHEFYIQVHDRDGPLYHNSETMELPSIYVSNEDLSFYSVAWWVDLWPKPHYLFLERSYLPFFFLVAGSVISLLLALSVYFAQSLKRANERMVVNLQSMKEEISERKKAEVKIQATL